MAGWAGIRRIHGALWGGASFSAVSAALCLACACVFCVLYVFVCYFVVSGASVFVQSWFASLLMQQIEARWPLNWCGTSVLGATPGTTLARLPESNGMLATYKRLTEEDATPGRLIDIVVVPL